MARTRTPRRSLADTLASPLVFLPAAFAIAFFAGRAVARAVPSSETTPYSVELRDGVFEIRRYPERVTASLRLRGTRDRTATSAFRPLFGYISGDNRAPGATDNEIPMTAPVVQTPSKGGTWSVSFIMPEGATIEGLPDPDDRLKLRTEPPQRAATVRFSGRWTDANFARHTRRLITWMEQRGLTPAGPATFAYYNAPFTPWFLRRNEVIIPLAD